MEKMGSTHLQNVWTATADEQQCYHYALRKERNVWLNVANSIQYFSAAPIKTFCNWEYKIILKVRV